eukprot:3104253-Rhodomonas_salina.1
MRALVSADSACGSAELHPSDPFSGLLCWRAARSEWKKRTECHWQPEEGKGRGTSARGVCWRHSSPPHTTSSGRHLPPSASLVAACAYLGGGASPVVRGSEHVKLCLSRRKSWTGDDSDTCPSSTDGSCTPPKTTNCFSQSDVECKPRSTTIGPVARARPAMKRGFQDQSRGSR